MAFSAYSYQTFSFLETSKATQIRCFSPLNGRVLWKRDDGNRFKSLTRGWIIFSGNNETPAGYFGPW